MYNEYEDEIQPDLWEEATREEVINELEVDAEVVEPSKKLKDLSKEEVKKATKEAVEDWKVVDEKDQEIKEKKKVKRILHKGPSKNRVQFNDGSTGHVNKDDTTIRYL